MKKLLCVMLSGIITLAVTAQTITITFNGTNANRNYQVILDGTSYYSNSAVDPNNPNANVKKEITLTNQELGSHTVEIYRLRNTGTYSNGTNTTPNGREVYSNTFNLRTGYDMEIAVNGMGQVAFKETRIRNQGRRGNNQTVNPMPDATFNQLLQTVRSRWTQTSKTTAERDAFSNTANYFSTSQVRQLLLLITAESSRLALAKLAYPRVTDPTNFTQLYDVFNSIASRDDMNAFIRNNPNYNNSGRNWGNNNNTTTYKTPMADYQFSQLLQTVNSKYNQSGKYTTIAGSLNNTANYFTVAQIRQLLSLINAESDRLALAKLSYARATDQTNFTSLYDLFYSQANRDDLNNFISGNTNTGYKTPMADYQFSQLLQTVNSQYNQSGKYTTIAGSLNNTANYFTVAQIRQLLSLINAESDRLALAKLSYARATDQTNFTSLYDLFYSQANRDDLNNFISGNTTSGYRTPMAEYQFNQLLQTVNNQYSQTAKYSTINGAFVNNANYFTTAQVRRLLTLMNAEGDRLSLAKQSYLRVTDPANFSTLYDLLNSQSSRNDLNNYVIQNGGTSTYNPQASTRTPMSDANFSQVLQKVSNHFLPWDKTRDARAAFSNTAYYFTTYQIRQILSVISSENDRLELAKLAWGRVTDPSNFTQLYDMFTSQANRDDLNTYIQAHPF